MARSGRPLAVVGITTVVGSAREADNAPVRGARLQLRNVVTGYIEATAVADQAGEFTFEGFEGGTYVVELVDPGDDVLAVGQVFNVAPGGNGRDLPQAGRKTVLYDRLFQQHGSERALVGRGRGRDRGCPDRRSDQPGITRS